MKHKRLFYEQRQLMGIKIALWPVAQSLSSTELRQLPRRNDPNSRSEHQLGPVSEASGHYLPISQRVQSDYMSATRTIFIVGGTMTLSDQSTHSVYSAFQLSLLLKRWKMRGYKTLSGLVVLKSYGYDEECSHAFDVQIAV
jgi:hypothetical protein